MNNINVLFAFPEEFPTEFTSLFEFDSTTGIPSVGDIVKITPDQEKLRVARREWVMNQGATQVHIYLEYDAKPQGLERS